MSHSGEPCGRENRRRRRGRWPDNSNHIARTGARDIISRVPGREARADGVIRVFHNRNCRRRQLRAVIRTRLKPDRARLRLLISNLLQLDGNAQLLNIATGLYAIRQTRKCAAFAISHLFTSRVNRWRLSPLPLRAMLSSQTRGILFLGVPGGYSCPRILSEDQGTAGL